jgi:hypothetical protein
MRDIFVERAQPEDSEELIAAMDATKDNLCDPAIFKYPSTVTLKAVRDKKNLVFMPLHPVYMLESLAINQGNTELDTAFALAELIKTVRWEAYNAGHGEMFFACKEKTTKLFAQKHGFLEVNVPLFKLRIR